MIAHYLPQLVTLAGCGLACLIWDTLTGTAFWQSTTRSEETMSPAPFDAFPVRDEDGSTSDYWDAYETVLAESFAITADADEVPFLLTDAELAELSSDVDDIPADDWDAAISDESIVSPF